MDGFIDKARLTCPNCGEASEHQMPTDACVFFMPCGSCGSMIEPKPGDCCVFCSYADMPCPPMQLGGACSLPGSGEDR